MRMHSIKADKGMGKGRKNKDSSTFNVRSSVNPGKKNKSTEHLPK